MNERPRQNPAYRGSRDVSAERLLVSNNDEPRLPSAGAKRWLVPGAVALAGLAAFGLVTWLLGLGPFAYRQILYGSTEIYLLNMTEQPVFVTLDRGKAIEVPPEGAERTPLLGGTTTISTRDAGGALVEEVEAVTAHWLDRLGLEAAPWFGVGR